MSDAGGPRGGRPDESRAGGAQRGAGRGRPPQLRRPPADPARETAYEVLRAVRERDAYANLVLPGLLRERRLAARDAALATELAYGALRGQGQLDAILRSTSLPVDCHLMIEDPDRWAPAYAEAGAGSVTFHVEACAAPVRLARTLRSAGARAGLALKPATPVEPYVDLLPELDMLLLMTVEPGFGGQPFLDVVLPKVRRARQAIGDRPVWLQVDGGVSEQTVERCVQAGADVLVAGSAVYGADDPAEAVQRLRAAAELARATST